MPSVLLADMSIPISRMASIASGLSWPGSRSPRARTGLATTSVQVSSFAGAADALFDRVCPLCYIGYGWRTERSTMLQLKEISGCCVLPLRLLDGRFSALATALCPLGCGHVL